MTGLFDQEIEQLAKLFVNGPTDWTRDGMHFVYIVRCADGSFYTGYARDPKARAKMHNAGLGAKYTRGRRPVQLVYSEACRTLSKALKREYEIKQWPRAEKRRLITARRRPSLRQSPKHGM